MLAPFEPPGVVTTTLCGEPGPPEGVRQVMVVELTTTTEVADEPPIFTLAGAIKLVPVIVTGAPPSTGPAVGEMAVTVGTPA